MNDSPGWASPGSPSGEQDSENGPGTPEDSAPPNWSKQQPPPGQWSAPAAPDPGDATPPPPVPGTGWGQPQGWQQPYWGKPPSPKPGVIPLRPLGVGEILDGAVSTMRAHWRTVLGISLVVALVTQTAAILLQGFALGQDSSLSAIDKNPSPTPDEIISALSGALAGSALTLIITLLGIVIATAMLTMVISRAVLGRPVTTRDAWTDARPQLPRLLGLTVLLGLIAFGILAAGVTPGILVGIAGSTGGGIALGFLGALPAFVVITWLMVRYTLSSPALMLEKQGVTKSMARSAKLVRGSWWRMFGIQLLAAFIVYMVSSVIQVPFVLLAGVAGEGGISGLVSGASGAYSWGSLTIVGIGAVIGSTITFPISAGVTALLYIDQRIRREALDIELARAAGLPGYGDAPADSATNGG